MRKLRCFYRLSRSAEKQSLQRLMVKAVVECGVLILREIERKLGLPRAQPAHS